MKNKPYLIIYTKRNWVGFRTYHRTFRMFFEEDIIEEICEFEDEIGGVVIQFTKLK